jgi:hypothetical protein
MVKGSVKSAAEEAARSAPEAVPGRPPPPLGSTPPPRAIRGRTGALPKGHFDRAELLELEQDRCLVARVAAASTCASSYSCTCATLGLGGRHDGHPLLIVIRLQLRLRLRHRRRLRDGTAAQQSLAGSGEYQRTHLGYTSGVRGEARIFGYVRQSSSADRAESLGL